jgi:hypothetical protein
MTYKKMLEDLACYNGNISVAELERELKEELHEKR